MPKPKNNSVESRIFTATCSATYPGDALIRRYIVRFTRYIRNPTQWKGYKIVSSLIRRLPFTGMNWTQV